MLPANNSNRNPAIRARLLRLKKLARLTPKQKGLLEAIEYYKSWKIKSFDLESA